MVSYSQTSDFKTPNKDFLAQKPTEIIFGKKKKKKLFKRAKHNMNIARYTCMSNKNPCQVYFLFSKAVINVFNFPCFFLKFY